MLHSRQELVAVIIIRVKEQPCFFVHHLELLVLVAAAAHRSRTLRTHKERVCEIYSQYSFLQAVGGEEWMAMNCELVHLHLVVFG